MNLVAGQLHPDATARPLCVPMTRAARVDEWQRSRELRLEMLADTPHSFGDRLADVTKWDDDRWRIRHESHLLPDSAVFVAVGADGRWVGHMAVREFRNFSPPRALLMGVYVTSTHRGDGTAASLLTAVESWVVGRGFSRLHLDVHQDALPAQKFYERHGYTRTGATHPYSLDEATSELEMVKDLTPRA